MEEESCWHWDGSGLIGGWWSDAGTETGRRVGGIGMDQGLIGGWWSDADAGTETGRRVGGICV